MSRNSRSLYGIRGLRLRLYFVMYHSSHISVVDLEFSLSKHSRSSLYEKFRIQNCELSLRQIPIMQFLILFVGINVCSPLIPRWQDLSTIITFTTAYLFPPKTILVRGEGYSSPILKAQPFSNTTVGMDLSTHHRNAANRRML